MFLSSLLNSLLSSLLAPALELVEDLSDELAPMLELLLGVALELLGVALEPLLDDLSPAANADIVKAAATAAAKRVSFIADLLVFGGEEPCNKCAW